MFAPRSGPYLLAGAGGLVVLLALIVIGLVHVSTWALAFLVVLGGLWGFLSWFFRDPERVTGADIVSAADGRVLRVESDGGRWQIAVFMNVTDVHVNRLPLDGTVVAIREGGDGFRPAYAADADHNVRRHYDLTTALGPVEVVQMTGAVARRLVSFVRPGDHIPKGQRFGMIVLGSRVDVFLPADRTEPVVRGGERVVAGVTTIARARP